MIILKKWKKSIINKKLLRNFQFLKVMGILKYNNYKIIYKIKNKAKSIINLKMKFRVKPILEYKQISN